MCVQICVAYIQRSLISSIQGKSTAAFVTSNIGAGSAIINKYIYYTKSNA